MKGVTLSVGGRIVAKEVKLTGVKWLKLGPQDRAKLEQVVIRAVEEVVPWSVGRPLVAQFLRDMGVYGLREAVLYLEGFSDECGPIGDLVRAALASIGPPFVFVEEGEGVSEAEVQEGLAELAGGLGAPGNLFSTVGEAVSFAGEVGMEVLYRCSDCGCIASAKGRVLACCGAAVQSAVPCGME